MGIGDEARGHRVSSDTRAERRLAVNPEIAGWSHLTFRTYGFAAGKAVPGESVDDEVLMLFLAGTASVTVGEQTWAIERGADVFAGPPQCLYLPPHHTYLLEPRTACEVAYARWPAQGLLPPRFIAPEALLVEERGSGVTAHRVTHIVRAGEAEHLICAEIVIPPGHWCDGASSLWGVAEPSFSPVAEKICYYRMEPAAGWALQRLYDDAALDETLVLRHGDATMVRDSRHPVVAAPDCLLYALHLGAVA